jgi:hypothetical protein
MAVWRPYHLKVFLSNRYTYASILHKVNPTDGGHYVAAASTLQRNIRQVRTFIQLAAVAILRLHLCTAADDVPALRQQPQQAAVQ